MLVVARDQTRVSFGCWLIITPGIRLFESDRN
jgi:hypothetical protein